MNVQRLAPKLEEPSNAMHHAETLQSLIDRLPELFIASDGDSHHDVLQKVKVVTVDLNLALACLFDHHERDSHSGTAVFPGLTRT